MILLVVVKSEELFFDEAAFFIGRMRLHFVKSKQFYFMWKSKMKAKNIQNKVILNINKLKGDNEDGEG